ncbi:MAG: replication initiator protein A, partial [Gemmiger formicilis]|uniref:replication initiator protein A n=1 Tax=Gemmiger formicilis TaxID=745368 RepID=UPI003A2B0967
MQFDYFYGSQADQFSFYRIPKVLFTDPQFKPLSTDAKVLYGILLDRMSLSVKNHWLDEQSRVYIIFTTEEIMEALSCANRDGQQLPEPPQLSDFDQSLQDYKKQIEAELEQEAAAAGLTVEEY